MAPWHLILLALSALLAPAAAAPAPQPEPLAPGVFVLRDRFDPGRQPDGNSVVFAGPHGLVVVDTGRHADHAEALLRFARSRNQPLVAVVNTHWHLDHLGGNALLRQRLPALRVFASDAVAPALDGWLAASRRDMQAMLARGGLDAATETMVRIDIALIDAGAQLLPTDVVGAARTIDPVGRPLQLGLERDAVSGGDLWVHDAASRVLAAGDLVTLPVPFLDTACASRWRAALERIEQVPFEILVPGHGAPMDRATFSTWRRAFGALLDCAAGQDPPATCRDAWIASMGPLLGADQKARSQRMLDHYLMQPLRSAPAQRDRFCPAR